MPKKMSIDEYFAKKDKKENDWNAITLELPLTVDIDTSKNIRIWRLKDKNNVEIVSIRGDSGRHLLKLVDTINDMNKQMKKYQKHVDAISTTFGV